MNAHPTRPFLLSVVSAGLCLMAAGHAAAQTAAPIPVEQLGAVAGQQYEGDGLAVAVTPDGARLRCVFQRLECEATFQGLWLNSTVSNLPDRFRVKAVEVGRDAVPKASSLRLFTSDMQLPEEGVVGVEGQTVRFIRPGLVEEYSVSLDGVRQDYIVTQRPAGTSELVLSLGVTGANVEQTTYGARLRLNNSGRKIAYSRLRVTDAAGKSLPARMDVRSPGADTRIEIRVNDADAMYPVRIDPTFSDANWISMGGVPGVDGGVYAAVVDGSGNLYIGGSFSHAGTVTANGVARWNGSEWSALGAGMNNTVWAMAMNSGTLYASGDFTTADGGAANHIAQWSGSAWLPMGSGMDGPVWALAVSVGRLVAGGSFTMAGGNAITSLAQWDGAHWTTVGSAVPSYIYALAVSGTTLYAAGQIQLGTNFLDTASVAQYTGTNWSRLGNGDLFGTPEALAASGGTLYVGGDFTQYSGTNSDGSPNVVVLNYIGKWDGSTWSALGSGMNDRVQSLAVAGGVVYAGGQFSMAGGAPAYYIAEWNNGLWSGMDAGANGNVQALVASGSVLFAGGGFSTVGSNAAACIARWNGTNWSALGSGMNSNVLALATAGNTLYAGGAFTKADTNTANGIAQWNGTNWLALGSGMGVTNSYVAALAVLGGTLYAGGHFATAGGIGATNIAHWNGTNWSALGSGISGIEFPPYLTVSVNALAVSGGTLYAGGSFYGAGGIGATNIAQWDGGSWSALGSGVNNKVQSLAVSGGMLYAGGWFTTAGTNVSSCTAEAVIGGAAVSPVIITNDAAFGFTNGVFGFDVSGPSGSNVVIQTGTNLQNWIPLKTNLLSGGLYHFSDAQASTNRLRFYRVQLLP